MPIPSRMNELLARFYDGSEQEIEVEYLGRFRVNGKMVLRIADARLERQWSESVVPLEYLKIYGLKCSEPELAGGLFESAPFAQYDPSAPQYEWLNPPPAPEPIYELCTDHCGAQFWVSKAGTVYGHSVDNKIQPVGKLADFVDFAIELAFEGLTWYQRINDAAWTRRFRLTPIVSMD